MLYFPKKTKKHPSIECNIFHYASIKVYHSRKFFIKYGIDVRVIFGLFF